MPDAKIEKDQVPKIYSKIAPLYDLWAWLTERNARSRCLQLAAILIRAEKKAMRTGNQHYRLRVGDAYELDFPSDSFDVVINNYMFDLLPEQDFPTVLTEFKRVLRPGGRLALVNMTQGARWYNDIWDSLYRMNPALLGGCRGVSLAPWLQQAGFRQTTIEYCSQFTFPSEVLIGIAP